MGKSKNFIAAKIRGNVGSMNFRKRGGDQIVAERSYSNSSKGNGATEAQRLQRIKIANVTACYRILKDFLGKCFENRTPLKSVYNCFAQANLPSAKIFLTKEQAEQGFAIPDLFTVSKGSLTPIRFLADDETLVMRFNLGSGYSTTTGTLGELARRIIDNNVGWRDGDKLTLLLGKRIKVTETSIAPWTFNMVSIEITLDVTSTALFSTLPVVTGASWSVNTEGELLLEGGPDGIKTVIHSRIDNGQLKCSTQNLWVYDVEDIYETWSSEAQQIAAMKSYGYQDAVLITPGRENA